MCVPCVSSVCVCVCVFVFVFVFVFVSVRSEKFNKKTRSGNMAYNMPYVKRIFFVARA